MPLTAASALRKDQTNARQPVMQHRHYAVVAGIIAKLGRVDRLNVAHHFAEELAHTNPKFDRARFLAACNPAGEPTANERKKTADRIDGYDRDDLGESPDY